MSGRPTFKNFLQLLLGHPLWTICGAGVIGSVLYICALGIDSYVESKIEEVLKEEYIGISYKDHFTFNQTFSSDGTPTDQVKYIPIYINGYKKTILTVEMVRVGSGAPPRKVEVHLDQELLPINSENQLNTINLTEYIKRSKAQGLYPLGENIHTLAFRSPAQFSDEAVSIKALVNIYGVSK